MKQWTKKEMVLFFILVAVISSVAKATGLRMSFTISFLFVGLIFVATKYIKDKSQSNKTAGAKSSIGQITNTADTKEISPLSKLVLFGVVLSIIAYWFVIPPVNIARFLGSLMALAIFAFLLGIIPFLLLRSRLKNSIIIVFGISFVLMVFISYFGNNYNNSQLPEPEIAELKTDKSDSNNEVVGNLYRNTKYGFRIKFPQGWKIGNGDGKHIVQKATSGNGTILVMVFQMDLAGNEGLSSIKDVGTVKEYVDMAMESPKQTFSDVKVINYGETKIDNRPAYWVEYSMTYETLGNKVKMTSITYSMAKGDTMYSIQSGTSSDDFEKIKPTFTNSISTFVFEN